MYRNLSLSNILSFDVVIWFSVTQFQIFHNRVATSHKWSTLQFTFISSEIFRKLIFNQLLLPQFANSFKVLNNCTTVNSDETSAILLIFLTNLRSVKIMLLMMDQVFENWFLAQLKKGFLYKLSRIFFIFSQIYDIIDDFFYSFAVPYQLHLHTYLLNFVNILKKFNLF